MPHHDIAYWIGVLLGGMIAGGLCGLIPLYAGKSRNNLTLGGIGFGCCVISGMILGLLLALPTALIFTAAVYLVNKPQQPTQLRLRQ